MGANRVAGSVSELEQLDARRRELLAELEQVDEQRHAAIVAELDAGASLSAVAAVLRISRQALTRYLNRRETDRA